MVFLAGAGFTAALPWVLSLPLAQRQLAAAANRILAPSRVQFRGISLSWTHSTVVSGVVLLDPQGDRILVAPRAVFNWSLSQILFARPPGGTLSIERGDLDIERFADGTVDLHETLKPVIAEYPKTRLVIRIKGGSLRFRDPAFSEPVIADESDLTIDLSVRSQPITWDIHLTRGDRPEGLARLDLAGEFSRAEIDPNGNHDVELALKAVRWPWTLASAAIESRGELSGQIDGQRRRGRTSLAGDATIDNLVAVGSLISTDTLHVDQARARWKIDGDGKGWNVELLDVSSSLGVIRGLGAVPPTPSQGAWIEGSLDLSALARQLPQTLHLRDDLRVERGTARLRADLHSNEKGDNLICNVSGKVTDLVAHQGQKTLTLPDPATLNAKIRKSAGALALERLEIQTPFLTADGQGDLDRGIAVTAALDLGVFRERFRDWIDLGGVVLSGKGKLTASYRPQADSFQARASGELRELRLDGLPMIGKIKSDLVTFVTETKGQAATSGWPADWRDLTLEVASDPSGGSITLLHDPRTGSLALSARAHTEVNFSGRHDFLEAALNAKQEKGGWSADRVSLALSPITPGTRPEAGPLTVRWIGRGHYDPSSGELSVESAPQTPREPLLPGTLIAGDQHVRIAGLKSPGTAQIEAAIKMDLASIGSWLAPAEEAWSGQLDALVRARPDRELWNLGLRVELHDPAQLKRGGSRFGIEGDVSLGVKAHYAPETDRLDVTEIGLKAPYVQLEGAGAIANVAGEPDLDLKGTLGLDWPAIEERLALKVEPGARITGRPRAWRLAGRVPTSPAIDRLGSLRGDIGVQIDSLDLFGMRLSETPIVLRAADGRLSIDPIDARLNGGHLHADPLLVRAKNGSTWLQLGTATRLEGAVINDEVSHRVLSFVAPVLDGATRVQGRVSFELAEAVFPIAGDPEAKAIAEGKVLFDDVRFMPGVLADQLLGVFRLEGKPLVELRDPVSVRITEGKVLQRGLVVPVGKVASIALDGSVDFDKNLDMVARFALTPPGSRMPVLSPLVENARFELPIRGTLANPRIDVDAMKQRWKAFGNSLLQGSMEAGMNGLQKLLQGAPEQPFRRLFPLSRTKAVTPEDRRRLREERRKDRLEKKNARLKPPADPE
jgi:translocation and assembly module TamB